MEKVTITYHLPLVLFSVFIAIFVSFATLDLGIRINKSKGLTRFIWLSIGVVVLGLGIWTMHFMEMLAFHLAIPISYNLTFIFISIFPAIISSAITFYTINKPAIGTIKIIISALFIAAGFVFMHYISMNAMVTEATIVYDYLFGFLTVIIAFIASLVALYLLISVSKDHKATQMAWKKTCCALIMGIGISSIHYTGMAAVNFITDGQPIFSEIVANRTFLAYSIGFGMLVILAIVCISIFVNKKFISQSIKSERKFRSVIESATDAIILYDSKGTIISWNKSAESIFGYNEKEAIGKDILLIRPENFRAIYRDELEQYLSTLSPNVIGKTFELQGLRKNGEEFPFELSFATWHEEGNIYFSNIIRDITERKQAETKIYQMVHQDPLTGLPNRLLLNNRLKLALEKAHENEYSLAVMFIDLDRFKNINDTLGHAIGDQLLVEVAKRIRSCISTTDTVSRQGGDEFIVLLPFTATAEATQIAQKIVNSFSHAIELNEHELFVTPSIGIALYPSDGNNIETLIKNADTAMYRVKEEGKNNYRFFTPDMNELITKKMTFEVGLRKALERNEFKIAYQPQIDLLSSKVIGVEALIRWHHPEWGHISPADFIPIAEETGLILPIGQWILHEACLQNKAWQDEGYPPLRMAVNISSRQFQQSNFALMVQNTLIETGLDPMYLEFELTESIIQNSKHAILTMHQLKDMGIHLSIDDFGTGYSSLSYLKTLPIDTLKIDQSFTKNIFTDPKDASLVSTIINMAHNLDLKVVAEGVETLEQLQFLQQRKCNEAQGYYFSRPLFAEELTHFLKKNNDH